MHEILTAFDQSIKMDAGKPRLSLVPTAGIIGMARVREYGLAKYGDSESWRMVDPERYLDALLRHAEALKEGLSSKDEESGFPHLWHLMCNANFLCELLND